MRCTRALLLSIKVIKSYIFKNEIQILINMFPLLYCHFIMELTSMVLKHLWKLVATFA